MTNKQWWKEHPRDKAKWDILRAADNLAAAASRFSDIAFDMPATAGDGTTWTDEEMRNWLSDFTASLKAHSKLRPQP